MTSCLVHLYSVSNGSCLHIHSLYLPVLIDSLWVMVSLPEDLGAVTPCSHHRALVCASLGLRLSHRSTSTYFRTLCSNVNTQKRDAEINTFNLWGNVLWLHYKNWMNSSEYSNMDIFFLSADWYFRVFPEQWKEDSSWLQMQDEGVCAYTPVGSVQAQGSFVSRVRWETMLVLCSNLTFFFCDKISENEGCFLVLLELCYHWSQIWYFTELT